MLAVARATAASNPFHFTGNGTWVVTKQGSVNNLDQSMSTLPTHEPFRFRPWRARGFTRAWNTSRTGKGSAKEIPMPVSTRQPISAFGGDVTVTAPILPTTG